MIMHLLDLLWTFFKIGLFGFGGGYAMIPLIQKAITEHSWLSVREFADIVAVSQMTPGPIGVNAATFIGMRTASLAGAIVATVGLALPSLIIVSIGAHMVRRFQESSLMQATLRGIRPAAIGLIGSAVMFFGSIAFIGIRDLDMEKSVYLDFRGVIIFFLILIGTKRARIHPIAAVLLSASLGVLLYVILPLPLS